MILELMLSMDELFVLSRVSHPGPRLSVVTGRLLDRLPCSAARTEVDTGNRRVRTESPTAIARRYRPVALRAAVGVRSEGLERGEPDGWVGIDPSSAEPCKKLSLEDYFLLRSMTSAGHSLLCWLTT